MIYRSILSDDIEQELENYGETRVLLDDIKKSICPYCGIQIKDQKSIPPLVIEWIDGLCVSKDLFNRYYIHNVYRSYVPILGIQYDEALFNNIHSINIDSDVLFLFSNDIVNWSHFPIWNGCIVDVMIVSDNQSKIKCVGDFHEKFPSGAELRI